MENDNILDKTVGTKEKASLGAAKVAIVGLTIAKVGDKKNKKINCMVKHPEKEELISISSAKIEQKGGIKVVGLWYNEDEDGNIQKGSALATLLTHLGADTLKDLEGKQCDTVLDDKGFLAFKAY